MDSRRLPPRRPMTETTGRLWKREKYRSTNQINTTDEPPTDNFVSNNHTLLTSEILPRVIVHLDADCFYAAVERVRLKIPPTTPLAVQQWNSLIAVDYNCRSKGVKRGMLAEEAKKLIPDLRCVHVRLLGEEDEDTAHSQNPNHNRSEDCTKEDSAKADRAKQKVSLSRYRTASFHVMNVFQRFVNPGDILLRASIDEAYLDITSSCRRAAQGRYKQHSSMDMDLLNDESIHDEEALRKALSVSCVVGSLNIKSPHDRLFIHAALIVKRIRDAVQNELGYSISAGIASNKLLAKIGSSKNKPKKQTIIPFRHGPSVLGNLPVKGVPGLGGKLGDAVCNFLREHVKKVNANSSIQVQHAIKFEIKNSKHQVIIKALQYVSESVLKKRFGQSTGTWLHRISHGVDTEILKSRTKPKSLLAMKSFEPKRSDSDVLEWIEMLAGEVHERYVEDKQNFRRRPTNLVLHHRGTRSKDHLKKWKSGDNNATPTCTIRTALPNSTMLTEDMIYETGKKLFFRVAKRLPCTRIGLSMSDFVDLPKEGKGSIKNAFGTFASPNLTFSKILTHAHTVIAGNTLGQPLQPKKGTDTNTHKKTEWGDIDQNVLLTLPEDIRKEIEKQYSNSNTKRRKKRSIRDMFSAKVADEPHSAEDNCSKSTAMSKTLGNDMPVSMQQPRSKRTKTYNHAPMPASFQDIDTAVLAELPEDIRLELSMAYKTNGTVANRPMRTCPPQNKKQTKKSDDSKIVGRKQKSLYDMFQRRTS